MLEDSEKMKKVEKMEKFEFWDERSSVRVRSQSEPLGLLAFTWR